MKPGALICEDVAACGPMRSFGAFCDRGCLRRFFDRKERQGTQRTPRRLGFSLAIFALLCVLCGPSYASSQAEHRRADRERAADQYAEGQGGGEEAVDHDGSWLTR